MSDNENPIHAPKPGRPFEGAEPRVSRTVTIAATTDRFISARLAPAEKLGRVIDRMAGFCEANGFDTPAKPTKKKKPATVSTPSPAKPATSGKA